MKHTKKMRGGFWFRRRNYSDEETNLFGLIKKIREKLICHNNVLNGISDSRNIFEKNINLYLRVLEIFRVDVEKTIYAYQLVIKNPSDYSDYDKKNNLELNLRVNKEYPTDFYYGVRHTHDSENTLLYYKILYAFLILEVKQLRDLQINLQMKLKSISGKKSHWFSSMFIRLPEGTNAAHLSNARETLRIKEEIKSIIKKFCNVNIDSFYDRFYNYIRKFKLNLSSSDKKKVMKGITDNFNKISEAISNTKSLTLNDLRRSESSVSPYNSDNLSNNSDNLSDNSSLYDYYHDDVEEENISNGGKRKKKNGKKKSRKLQKNNIQIYEII